MDRAFLNGPIIENIKDNIKIIKNKEEEFLFGLIIESNKIILIKRYDGFWEDGK